MKKNVASMVLGIIYSLGMPFAAYMLMAISAFALAAAEQSGDPTFIPGAAVYLGYAAMAMGVVCLVTSCFAIKNIKVTRIGQLIATCTYGLQLVFALIALLSATSGDANNFITLLAFGSALIVGVIATILAFKAKPKAQPLPQTE